MKRTSLALPYGIGFLLLATGLAMGQYVEHF